MKIGVMSDTHLREPDDVLERILTEIFVDTDIILHAGDIVTHKVLDRLEESGVLAVCGNMDDYEISSSIPQERVIQAAGMRIGLVHGWGSRIGLAQRILERFDDPKLDLVVYGHSHETFWGKINGVRMFNPGSATPRGTVGVIEIVDGKMEGRFFPVPR
jgi:putative phosphoesterase